MSLTYYRDNAPEAPANLVAVLAAAWIDVEAVFDTVSSASATQGLVLADLDSSSTGCARNSTHAGLT